VWRACLFSVWVFSFFSTIVERCSLFNSIMCVCVRVCMCVYTLPSVYGPFFCLVYLDHSLHSVSLE
jgi:hypothetical protein